MPDQAKKLNDLKLKIDAIKTEFSKVIVGQDVILEKILIGLLTNSHCLLVGVPGLAKTLIIKTLSQILGLDFKRIQFTPDLMPSDITGTEVLDVDPETSERYFKFIKGPLFANIVLADEINRTPPKTQSALLEAMQEHTITVNGKEYELAEPFFVMATQNPIEQEGTYPLPEAQLDRFLFQLNLDYPSYEEEVSIVTNTMRTKKIDLNIVVLQSELIGFQQFISELEIEKNVIEYAVNIVQSTRTNANHNFSKYIRYGAGPRASQNLVIAAKALAAIRGDLLAEKHHVDELLDSVLSHRVLISYTGEAEGFSKDKLISELKSLHQ